MATGAEAIAAAIKEANPVRAEVLEERMSKMQGIIDGCMKDIVGKFTAHEEKIESLTTGVQGALAGLQSEVNLIKASTTPTGSGGGGASHVGGNMRKGGIINRKSMLPSAFGGGKADFMAWAEDVRDYLETSIPGIAKLLEDLAKEEGEGEVDDVKNMRAAIDIDVETAGPMVYTVVKKFTSGEARAFVRTGPDGEGFRA